MFQTSIFSTYSGLKNLYIGHSKLERNCERANGRVTTVYEGTQEEPMGANKMVPWFGPEKGWVHARHHRSKKQQKKPRRVKEIISCY
jgi:hypothetical protein